MIIRRATHNDIPAIAAINRASFSGNKLEGLAEQWITSHINQGDQYHYFVAEDAGRIVGYIGWELKGGFARDVPVIELEQLAVHPDVRGKGVGGALVNETFVAMKAWLRARLPAATSMRVFVWTKKGNAAAQALYEKICTDGVTTERNIYGSDEVMLRGVHAL